MSCVSVNGRICNAIGCFYRETEKGKWSKLNYMSRASIFGSSNETSGSLRERERKGKENYGVGGESTNQSQTFVCVCVI